MEVMTCCRKVWSAMFLFSFAMRIKRSFASNPQPFSNCWVAMKTNCEVIAGLKKLLALVDDNRVLLNAAENEVPV